MKDEPAINVYLKTTAEPHLKNNFNGSTQTATNIALFLRTKNEVTQLLQIRADEMILTCSFNYGRAPLVL